MIRDFMPAAIAVAVAIEFPHDEINLALDPSTVRRRRQWWPGEEVRLAVVLVVDEEATHTRSRSPRSPTRSRHALQTRCDTTRLRAGRRLRMFVSRSLGHFNLFGGKQKQDWPNYWYSIDRIVPELL